MIEEIEVAVDERALEVEARAVDWRRADRRARWCGWLTLACLAAGLLCACLPGPELRPMAVDRGDIIQVPVGINWPAAAWPLEGLAGALAWAWGMLRVLAQALAIRWDLARR